MKRFFIILLLFSTISACSIGTKLNRSVFNLGKEPVQVCTNYQGMNEEQIDTEINNDIYLLQQSIERSLVFREKVTETLRKAGQQALSDKPFNPERIDRLSRSLQLEVDLMRPIIKALESYQCWLEFEPDNVTDEIKLKGLMIVLATSLSLYDDYITIFAVLNENERLRRFINHADSGYNRDEFLLEGLTEAFVEDDGLSQITRLINRYHAHEDKIKIFANTDDNLMYLVKVVETSKSYPVLLNIDYLAIEEHRQKVRENVTADTLNELGRSTVDALSGGFSNAIGDYEDRKGLLYANNEVEKYVAGQLQMGDILLEKTPFRLTDSMIPGHWGHAAIWVGTESELKKLGLWMHPLVSKYHENIRRGELVIESLRTGTTLSSLEHFLNVDDLAILRSRQPLTDELMRETIILALRQMGKAYDFNFDVETTDKIVCSELVYLAYDKIKWPTESVVGRYTISPDNIAVKALNKGPFNLVLFYHDGNLIKQNKLELMESLMYSE